MFFNTIKISIMAVAFFSIYNFASADITSGLVSHWKMDETSGTTVSDSVGANNGTLSGATWTTGKSGNALSFNGTNDYVSVPKMNYDEIAVSAWFYKKADDTTSSADSIWGGWRWESDNQLREGFDIRFFSSPNTIELIFTTTNGTIKTTKTSIYNMVDSKNAWHHVVGVYNKTTGEQKLYVDGVLRHTAIHAPGNTIVPLTYYADMRIGYSRVNNGYFNGLIDDVRVYNRALTDSEVTEIYNYTESGSSSSVQPAPSATTNPASDITSTSVTLNGLVNNNGLTATAYFEYGLTTAFGDVTSSQTITNPGNTTVNSSILNLSPYTVYYYRIVAKNSRGTTYGNTQSFTTSNTNSSSSSSSQPTSSKPTGSVTVNFNASVTDYEKVMLNLSATDDVGVTGYYVSENSTIPTATQSGWTSVISSASYSANPFFTFTKGDGTKTIYTWYKDVANNISATYSDSITLSKNDSWKNQYTIPWRDTAQNSCKYAKQMGYEYVALRIYNTPEQYKTYTECSGLKFFLDNPQYWILGHNSNVDINKTYTQTQIDYYNKNMAWKSNDTFPNNFATGWWANDHSFAPIYDMQQQAVIDKLVNDTIARIRSYELANISIAGYMFDISKFTGDFDYWDGTQNIAKSISFWTGKDSSILHPGITHEYETFSEGMVAYYKQLKARTLQEFPDTKWIIEPWVIYYVNSSSSLYVTDEWINQTKNRSDKNELIPDMLNQESSLEPGTEFVDNANNFNSGLYITKDMVGSSQSGNTDELYNRRIAAKAGINQSWYNWFGHFGTNPNFQSITEFYPRLKLIRAIPNWDNLRNIPLAQRSWNNNTANPIYSSKKNSTDPNPTSYFDANVMYSRHWKNNKLFAVFNNNLTPIKLNPEENITSIKCTDDFFIETIDCANHFDITNTTNGKQITLKSTISIPKDSSGKSKGIGYIIATINSSSSNSSSSSSSSSKPASSSSSSSATPSSSSSKPASSSSQSSSSSTKFQSGDKVVTTSNLNVRSTASLTGTLLGTQDIGALGVVISGPVLSGGYSWYYINYDTASDGWSVDDYLEKTNISSSSSQPSGGGGGGGNTNRPISSSSSSQSSSSAFSFSSQSSSSISVQQPTFPTLQTTTYSPSPKIVVGPFSIGMRSDEVKILQEMLASDPSIYPEGEVSGYYGPSTTRAVKLFQARHNIEQSGLAGPKTRSKLNEIYGGVQSVQQYQTQTTTSSYVFTRELNLGSKGNDVSELQKRLTAEGVYFGPITGYFGPMTREGIEKYQTKNNITSIGRVGPQTLKLLNGSTSQSSTQDLNLSQLVEFLISFGIIAPDKVDLARAALKTMEGK